MLCRLKWPIARHSKTRFFQNSNTGKKPFNFKKYIHMIITKLRNCAKLELRKSGIGQFCAKWLLRMIAQIVFFRATKEKICVSLRKHCAKIAQKFCEWKPCLQSCSKRLCILKTDCISTVLWKCLFWMNKKNFKSCFNQLW